MPHDSDRAAGREEETTRAAERACEPSWTRTTPSTGTRQSTGTTPSASAGQTPPPGGVYSPSSPNRCLDSDRHVSLRLSVQCMDRAVIPAPDRVNPPRSGRAGLTWNDAGDAYCTTRCAGWGIAPRPRTRTCIPSSTGRRGSVRSAT